MAKAARGMLIILGVAGMAGLSGLSAQDSGTQKTDGEIVFRHVLDNAPIEFTFKPDQEITKAVETFHKTAENPYRDQQQAIADGKKIYTRLCAACHLKDGTGRIGPSLVDDKYRYDRVATDKGKFEIIYAGGAGAMQAFGRRITQDEILRVMAYLEKLKAEGP